MNSSVEEKRARVVLGRAELDELRSLDSLSYGQLDLQKGSSKSGSGVTGRIKRPLVTRELIKQGIEHLKEGLSSLTQSPNSQGQLLCLIAHLHLLIDQFTNAYSAYCQYSRLCPSSQCDPALYYGLAIIHKHLKQYQQSEEAYRKVLSLAPSFPRAGEVHLQLGLLFKKKKFYNEAVFHLEIALNKTDQQVNDFMIRFHLAHINELQGKMADARSKYEVLLGCRTLSSTDRATIQKQLGWLLHKLPEGGDETREKSLELLKLASQARPQCGETWYLLGRVLASQQQCHDAFKAYQRAIHTPSKIPPANTWHSIGHLYFQMHQPRDSLQAYLCSVYLDILHFQGWKSLGCLYEAIVYPTEALICYQNAMIAAVKKGIRMGDEVDYVRSRIEALQQYLSTVGVKAFAPHPSMPPLHEAWTTLIPLHIRKKQPSPGVPLLTLNQLGNCYNYQGQQQQEVQAYPPQQPFSYSPSLSSLSPSTPLFGTGQLCYNGTNVYQNGNMNFGGMETNHQVGIEPRQPGGMEPGPSVGTEQRQPDGLSVEQGNKGGMEQGQEVDLSGLDNLDFETLAEVASSLSSGSSMPAMSSSMPAVSCGSQQSSLHSQNVLVSSSSVSPDTLPTHTNTISTSFTPAPIINSSISFPTSSSSSSSTTTSSALSGSQSGGMEYSQKSGSGNWPDYLLNTNNHGVATTESSDSISHEPPHKPITDSHYTAAAALPLWSSPPPPPSSRNTESKSLASDRRKERKSVSRRRKSDQNKSQGHPQLKPLLASHPSLVGFGDSIIMENNISSNMDSQPSQSQTDSSLQAILCSSSLPSSHTHRSTYTDSISVSQFSQTASSSNSISSSYSSSAIVAPVHHSPGGSLESGPEVQVLKKPKVALSNRYSNSSSELNSHTGDFPRNCFELDSDFIGLIDPADSCGTREEVKSALLTSAPLPLSTTSSLTSFQPTFSLPQTTTSTTESYSYSGDHIPLSCWPGRERCIDRGGGEGGGGGGEVKEGEEGSRGDSSPTESSSGVSSAGTSLSYSSSLDPIIITTSTSPSNSLQQPSLSSPSGTTEMPQSGTTEIPQSSPSGTAEMPQSPRLVEGHIDHSGTMNKPPDTNCGTKTKKVLEQRAKEDDDGFIYPSVPFPSLGSRKEYMILEPELKPPAAPPFQPGIELRPRCPEYIVRETGETEFDRLLEFCNNTANPICLIKGLVDAIGLDLDLFSSQKLVETCADHEMEVREQVKQAADENSDTTSGRQIWRCESSKSITTVAEYASYQHKMLLKEREVGGGGGRGGGSGEGGGGEERELLSFGTNVDISDKNIWSKQLRELDKLPHFLRVSCPEMNLLSHIGHTVLGMNSVQLYMKVAGSRTPGHQENNNFCSLNINIGPGTCEWFAVPNSYWGVLHRLCEKHKVNFLVGSWWPVLEELRHNKIPVYRFTQHKGEVIFINPGTIHWVQANSVCNNIAWNTGPPTAHQFRMAWERYQWNKVQNVRSIVPMVHLTWNMAKRIRLNDAHFYWQVRSLLESSLAQTKLLLNHLTKAGVPIMWHGRLDGEPAPYCNDCAEEVFNVLFVLSHRGEYLVYCHRCAGSMKKTFTVLQQYKMEELKEILAAFSVHLPDN